MPITLGQLTANRKPATVSFGDGDELHIEYYPMRLTSKMLADYAAADAVQQQSLPTERMLAVLDSAADTLAVLLASWDMVESMAEDGTPGPLVPITRERLAAFGLPVLWAILGVIMRGAGSMGEPQAPEHSPRKASSGATSSPTASRARSRTGTQSSARRAISK